MERPFLNYFGGKFAVRDKILEHFPAHDIYVEVFGGGGSILFSKGRSKHEIFNDINSEIVNVFRQARDNGDKLKRLLELTPFSREELKLSYEKCDDPLEQARRTLTQSHMSITKALNHKSSLRNSTQVNRSPAKSWAGWVDYFDAFIERLRGVVIENRSFEDMFSIYDSESTLFYLDPPYVKETRGSKYVYKFEMSNEDHEKMVELLKNIRGNVVLSGYENPIYEKLKWETFSFCAHTQHNKVRKECLWVKGSVNMSLFSGLDV